MFDVAHIITTIERGGAENQLLILVREQIRRGLKVAVIPLKGKLELHAEFLKLGVKVFHEMASISVVLQIFTMRKIASDSLTVHCHLPRAELIGVVASKPSKVVISRHNTEPFFPGAPLFLSRLLSKFVLSRAQKCIAISTAVADYLVSSGELPKNRKPEVIPYGFDIDFAKNINLEFDIESDILARLKEAKFVITSIGRLTAQKDFPTLFKAFQVIQVKEPNSLLVVIGEGDLRSELMDLSCMLNLSNRIIWVGKTQSVASFLSCSDIFVLTSRYEGFGLVLLEAMSIDIPIVASRNSAISEVLTHAHFGLVETGDHVGFAQKILHLREEPARSALVDFQKARLANFSPIKMESAIFQAYSH